MGSESDISPCSFSLESGDDGTDEASSVLGRGAGDSGWVCNRECASTALSGVDVVGDEFDDVMVVVIGLSPPILEVCEGLLAMECLYS